MALRIFLSRWWTLVDDHVVLAISFFLLSGRNVQPCGGRGPVRHGPVRQDLFATTCSPETLFARDLFARDLLVRGLFAVSGVLGVPGVHFMLTPLSFCVWGPGMRASAILRVSGVPGV